MPRVLKRILLRIDSLSIAQKIMAADLIVSGLFVIGGTMGFLAAEPAHRGFLVALTGGIVIFVIGAGFIIINLFVKPMEQFIEEAACTKAQHDIKEYKEDNESIKRMAYHDALTGLPNRYLFDDRLSVALEQARRYQHMLGVMFLDLDHFKCINDTLGHAVGDQFLQEVARRLQGCLREGDTVSRMGGDEFTVLLPEVISQNDAVKVAQRVIEALKQPFWMDDRELYITSSIGIAIHPKHGEDAETLLRLADVAMYQAKSAGRNNYKVFTPGMNAGTLERMDLECGLRHALERQELLLYYQPQLDVRTGKIVGAEALLRWQNPKWGLVLPLHFIPLAEENGLISSIGEWVLRTACAQNVMWQKSGYSSLRIAVNLSVRQFQQPNLVRLVADVLEETGLDPELLELEITESVAMQNVDFTSRKLKELKRMGVRIAIDDFGIGYSSLNYLKRLPITTLKIDKTFINDCTSNHEDAMIISAVVALAKSLQYKVIAEGVETHGQFAFLQKTNCDEVQGYLFGKPVPAEDFERLFSNSLQVFKSAT
ncbi:MAG: putative bifunctional diguanylate cyclase/phosphodiesterase [Desulfitobacteriaceae bacterium]